MLSYRQSSGKGIPIVHAHQEFRGDTFNDYTPGKNNLWFKTNTRAILSITKLS